MLIHDLINALIRIESQHGNVRCIADTPHSDEYGIHEVSNVEVSTECELSRGSDERVAVISAMISF